MKGERVLCEVLSTKRDDVDGGLSSRSDDVGKHTRTSIPSLFRLRFTQTRSACVCVKHTIVCIRHTVMRVSNHVIPRDA